MKLHLADDSLELTLFEAADRLGGVIYTERESGFLIDHGADMFAVKPPAALDLCRQLGLEDRLIEPQPTGRGARIVRRGRLVAIPNGFVVIRATQFLPMLTTPLLSPWRKTSFPGRALDQAKARGRQAADESVSDFVCRRMGREVLDRIVAPLSAGIYTADITKLSMQATMGPVAEMERQYGSLAKASTGSAAIGSRFGRTREHRCSLRPVSGIQGRHDRAHPRARRRVARKYDSLERHPSDRSDREGGTWTVTTGRRRAHEFDHVVVALPPKPTARLIRSIAPAAADELEAIESASTAIVVLGVRRSDVQNDVQTFGFVVPLSEHRRILAGSFASNKFAGRAPDDQTLDSGFHRRCDAAGVIGPIRRAAGANRPRRTGRIDRPRRNTHRDPCRAGGIRRCLSTMSATALG